MEAPKSIFSIYFAYFVFAMLMHSIFITIEQSIYVYAIDKSKAFTLLIMNYLGVLVASIFLPYLLANVSYKKSVLFFLGMTGIVCLPMPFTTSLDIPKVASFIIGLMYGGNRIATYAFLKNIYPKEQAYASIINKLDAMFALGFIVTWGIFGTLIIFSISWLIFFAIMVACLLLAIIWVALAKYVEVEKVVNLGQEVEENNIRKNLINNILAFFKRIPHYFIRLVKGIWESVIDLLKLGRNSMAMIFTVSVVFLSLIQVHFIQCISQIVELYADIPNIDTYFMIISFLSIFLGRMFASFILRIVQSLYVLTTALILLGAMILLTSMASIGHHEEAVLHFHELPPSVWLIPAMGFVWGPVMPTLCATAFFHLDIKKTYTLAGIVLLAIFGTEAVADGLSAIIFKQFSFDIALILGVIPVVLLLIVSLLFINDLKNTEKYNTL